MRPPSSAVKAQSSDLVRKALVNKRREWFGMSAGVAVSFLVSHHNTRWQKVQLSEGDGPRLGHGVARQDQEQGALAEIPQDPRKTNQAANSAPGLVMMEMMVAKRGVTKQRVLVKSVSAPLFIERSKKFRLF